MLCTSISLKYFLERISKTSKLERGDVELTITKLYKIAEILEVDISQIFNFDASKIFNVKDYGVANVDIQSQTNNYTDPYKDKYIQLLEAEVERLKKMGGK